MSTVPKLRITPVVDQCPQSWHSAMDFLDNLTSPTGIVCEPFVEHAFLKGTPVPLGVDWIGFSHLTFHEGFSSFNLTTLFNESRFLDCLPFCRGIYVFSGEMQQKWKEELAKLHISITIERLTHPVSGMSIPETKFSLSKFMANKDRKLLQIGSWQRQWLSILRVGGRGRPVHVAECVSVTRAILSSKPVKDYVDTLREIIIQGASGCEEPVHRAFFLDSFRDVEDDLKNIDFLPSTSPVQYVQLLTENVLFFHLHSVSSVQAILDAIVHDCPFIVNRVPSVVELVTPDYPLFYDTLEQAAQLLTLEKLRAAVAFLSALDKNRFTFTSFRNSVVTGTIYRNLPALGKSVLESRSTGCYVGSIVGNQLPFTGDGGRMSAEHKQFTTYPGKSLCSAEALPRYRWPLGSHSDECEMTLCLVHSLTLKGDFDPSDNMDKFVRWMTEAGQPTPCSAKTRHSLQRYLSEKLASYQNKGNPYQGLVRSCENGNEIDAGPLLRIFPLLLWSSDNPSRMRRLVQSYVELTHGSRECVEAALVFANAVLGLFYGKSKDLVLGGAQTIDVLPLHTQAGRDLLSGQYVLKERQQLAPRGSAFHVLECALWALAKTASFEDGMNLILDLDDATNESSTVYGALAGVLYGVSGVPEKWLEGYQEGWNITGCVADLILGWGRRVV